MFSFQEPSAYVLGFPDFVLKGRDLMAKMVNFWIITAAKKSKDFIVIILLRM